MAGRKISDCGQFIESLGTDPDDVQIENNDDAVKKLLRSDLAALSKHLKLNVQSNSVKRELLKAVVFELNDKGLVSEQYVESFDPPVQIDQSQSILVHEETVDVVQAKSEARQRELEIQSEARQRELEIQERMEKEKLLMEKERLEKEKDKEEKRFLLEKEKLLIEKEKERERLDREAEIRRITHKQELEKEIQKDKSKQASAEARKIESDAMLREAQARALDEGRSHGIPGTGAPHTGPVFNASQHVRMVPPFNDKDIEAYLAHFEHIASSMEWPKDKWSILISTSLKGKAQVAYAAMETVDKCSYEKVKIAILRSYEQVPESYRQSFRNLKKNDNQTHVDYVKDKSRYFDKWTRSRDVADYDSLRNLILMEDFKDNVPRNVRTHIDDLDITEVQAAARRADDYSITHRFQPNPTQKEGFSSKNGGKQKPGNQPSNKGNGKWQGHEGSRADYKTGQDKPKSGKWCELHRSTTHNTDDCHTAKMQKAQSKPVSVASHRPTTPNSKDRNQGAKSKDTYENQSSSHTVSLAVHRSNEHTPSAVELPTHNVQTLSSDTESDCDGTDDTCSTDSSTYNDVGTDMESNADFHGDTRFIDFVSKGGVAAPPTDCASASAPQTKVELGSSTKFTPVHVLRDTGSTQSLLREGVIPLLPEHHTGNHVLVTGISGETMPIPLYKVALQSGLLSPNPQIVIIGVTEKLPVAGVEILIGNDLAGPRVVSEPILSSTPVCSASTEMLEKEFQDCFPSCVVTRAQRTRLLQAESEDKLNRPDQTDGPVEPQGFEFDLSDTFLHTLNESPPCSEYNADSPANTCSNTRESVIKAQHADIGLHPYFEQALSHEEAEKVPTCYVLRDGLLTKKFRCPLAPADDENATKYLVVAPKPLRAHILELAHDVPTSGHLGVRKTKSRVC